MLERGIRLARRLLPPSARRDIFEPALADWLASRHQSRAGRPLPRQRLAEFRGAATVLLLAIDCWRVMLWPGRFRMGWALRDARDSFHRLWREPGFAAAAILTLGLGMGANAAVFTLIKAALLEPLPYGEPDRLTVLWNPQNLAGTSHLSRAEIAAYDAGAPSFESVAGYAEVEGTLIAAGDPERVRGAAVSPSLFSTLRVAPILGRAFHESEGRSAQSDVVILGHGLWTRAFGSRTDVIGQPIDLSGRRRVVVGVMPPAFRLPIDYRRERPSEIYTPLVMDPSNLGQWGDRSYYAVARLADGREPSAANSDIAVLWDRWVKAGFVANQNDQPFSRAAIPVHEFVSGGARPTLFVLMGTVAFVLLIGIGNVINLSMARLDARRRQLAVHAALGAPRWRLVHQMLAESLALAAAAAALGLALAYAGIRVLVAVRPAGLPRVDDVAIDAGVLIFTGGLVLFSAFCFGLLPAMALSRPDVATLLREGGRSTTSGPRGRLVRDSLLVAQMALSIMLAIGALLLTRSLIAQARIDPGFDARNILTARVQLTAAGYPENADAVRFYRALEARLSELPGVSAAGAIRTLPLTRPVGDWSIMIEGRPYVREENPNGDFQVVLPGYFQAMGIPALEGRTLDPADREDAPLVAVINDVMAKRYWPDGAVGNRFKLGTGDTPWLTIVGVVRSIRHNTLIDAPRAELYVPHAQAPRAAGFAPYGMTLVLKTDAAPETLSAHVQSSVRAIDPRVPLSEVRSMEAVMARTLSQPRFVALLLGVFALVAVTLAAIGTYGVVALVVAERLPEIGIRLALGARPHTILSMFLRQGLRRTAHGIALGVAGALYLRTFVENLVYGVSTLDPATFVVVPLLLAGVTFFALLRPAWRAARLDPIATLRRN